MDKYIELAQKSIEHYLKKGEILPVPVNLPEEFLTKAAGSFVSLHDKRDGSLRGCIGTFLPTKIYLAQEIISNAIAAATKDPRFIPVMADDLPNIEVKVDVLSPPEPIENLETHDPKKYGLLLKTGDGRSGLLLPDLEGIETAEKQFAICADKGGINPKTDRISLFRFTVERHK